MSEYDSDILAWSEHQADALRRIAAVLRMRRNENDEVDWENVIEEIESVGREQLHAVESLLTQAFLHDLKAEAWPLARDVEKWRADARLFRRQAKRRFTESMRQRLDIPGLYADALAGLPEKMDGQEPLSVPQECPVTLDDLLSEP